MAEIRSIRDFAPDEEESEERLLIIEDIRDELQGEWVNKVEDSSAIELIDNFLAWETPDNTPEIEEVPVILKRNLMGREGEENYLLTLYPKEERKDGRNAMAFTEDLYSVNLPDNVRGPIGGDRGFCRTSLACIERRLVDRAAYICRGIHHSLCQQAFDERYTADAYTIDCRFGVHSRADGNTGYENIIL